MSKNDGDFFKGLIAGGLIGAGLLFLFGTEKGKKTQKLLRKKGEELIDDLADQADQLQEKGKKLKKQAEKRAVEMKKDIAQKVDDVGEKLIEKTDKGLDAVLDKGQGALESAREAKDKARFFKKDGKSLS